MSQSIRYSSAQKAVATLVAIGKPKASELLKFLTHDEIRRLMTVSKAMSAVTQDGLELIVSEFEAEFTKGAGLLDSSAKMDAILDESFDDAELEKLRGTAAHVAPETEKKITAWELLAQTEASTLAEYLQTENAHVGAFILSRLPSAQAAEIMNEMGREDRTNILARMMSIAEPSTDAVSFIEQEIVEQFGKSKKGNTKSALARVASILNELGRDTTEETLVDLANSADEGEVSTVRSMLFRFEDINILDPAARTTIFDAIATDTLTMALREADPDLTEAILSSISQRTRRMIEADLKSKIQVRAADISAARKMVVNRALQLSGEGKIELPSREQAAA